MIARVSRGVAEAPVEWESTEREVVCAARDGCTDSFSELYTGLEKRVRRTVRRILRDEHAAEDAVQETFLAVLEGLCSLNDVGAFDGWVLRIARHKAISMARRRDRCTTSMRVHDDVGELGAVGGIVVHRSGAAEPGPLTLLLLRSAYEELSVGVREVLRLKYGEGLSCEAIARAHGITLSCVKTRLHRGRRDLYRALGRHAD